MLGRGNNHGKVNGHKKLTLKKRRASVVRHPLYQFFYNCPFADTRFAHQHNIVLAGPSQDMHHLLEFGFPANQRKKPLFSCHPR